MMGVMGFSHPDQLLGFGCLAGLIEPLLGCIPGMCMQDGPGSKIVQLFPCPWRKPMTRMAQDAVMFHEHLCIDPSRLPVEGIGPIFWQAAVKYLGGDHIPIIELMFLIHNPAEAFPKTRLSTRPEGR